MFAYGPADTTARDDGVLDGSGISWFAYGPADATARDDGVLDGSGISWTICKQSAPHSDR